MSETIIYLVSFMVSFTYGSNELEPPKILSMKGSDSLACIAETQCKPHLWMIKLISILSGSLPQIQESCYILQMIVGFKYIYTKLNISRFWEKKIGCKSLGRGRKCIC